VAGISRFATLVAGGQRLAVIALALPDGTAHASVANAGVIRHQ
jgi:hypothetical protein